MIPSWLWAVLFYAGALLVGGVVLHMISRRRPPAATMAWLLLIVSFPWVGVPAYLAIGGRKVRRAARRKGALSLTNPDGPDEPVNALDHLIRSNNLGRATDGNDLCLHQNAAEAYAHLRRLLHSAQRSISMAMYIFQPDHIGTQVRDLLAEKARAGVRVRLLVDDIGSLGAGRKFFHPLTAAGGQLQYFMPIFRLPFRWRTDLRNHRKIVLVDEREVLAGGRNVGDHYFAEEPGDAEWVDLSFTIRGPAVRPYVELFEADWASATDRPIADAPAPQADAARAGEAVLQVVPSGPDVPDDPLFDAMLKAIYGARRRLWITTPYFVPEASMDRALTCAARSGVDVRIVIPVRTDNLLPDLARWRHLRVLQAVGARVFFYTPSMLHSKAVVCDDNVAIVGSANMDVRSLFLNYEAVVFCYSPAEVGRIADWVEQLFARGREGVPDAGRAHLFAEQVIGLVEPLL